jgi:chemotaxis methyl-accepting protein methylase
VRSALIAGGPAEMVEETMAKILNQLWAGLELGGYLLVSGAETVLNLQERFERIAFGATVIYRKR